MIKVKLFLLIFLISFFSLAETDFNKFPDVINCQFKVQATIDYSVTYKKFETEAGKDTFNFSFKIAGLSRGKPVIVSEDASNELLFIKHVGNSVYLVEDVELGFNVIMINLKSKKVTLTKQYDIGNGSPFVYAWVGEAIY